MTVMPTEEENQYLKPEYVTGMPTPLDAANSPLALMARACSKIGADDHSSSRPIIPPLEKKKMEWLRRSPAHSNDRRTPSGDSFHKQLQRSPMASPTDLRINAVDSSSPSPPPTGHRQLRASPRRLSPPRSLPGPSLSPPSSRINSFNPPVDSIVTSSLPPTCVTSAVGFPAIPRPPCFPPAGIPPGFSPMLHPFLLASMARTLPKSFPICSDPFCGFCVLQSQAMLMGLPLSPNNCPNLVKAQGPRQPEPKRKGPKGSRGTSPKASSPPLAPLVCNWLVDGMFCGKSFSSSEDLMCHLRTHTPSPLQMPLPPFLPPHPAMLPHPLGMFPPVTNPTSHDVYREVAMFPCRTDTLRLPEYTDESRILL
ncbi:unnamed protein product [Cyprideis torosa]|uniref:Uncharacterized protein n=1 Tax=Cyprideis torosa TaxID=163714 RepID=A0A7R8WA40_9CRUS|nr:unnamed protein product [Cyprideis torosa]CAG0890571.1 unnamed protein product [Cyprideis torosa]